MKITFFGTQPYDRESFDRANERYGFEFNYHRSHLNGNNTSLAQGADAVCIFVNDTADAATIRSLAAMDVKLIALRCAGFNNVDLKAAAEYGIPVVRVPAYSPHAVAEYAVMLMLTLNRKVHRAYWRTRDGNFSLHGLLGFDMYGKTAGFFVTIISCPDMTRFRYFPKLFCISVAVAVAVIKMCIRDRDRPMQSKNPFPDKKQSFPSDFGEHPVGNFPERYSPRWHSEYFHCPVQMCIRDSFNPV